MQNKNIEVINQNGTVESVTDSTYTDWLIEYLYYPTDPLIQSLEEFRSCSATAVDSDQLSALMEVARARCYTFSGATSDEVSTIQDLLKQLNPDFTL